MSREQVAGFARHAFTTFGGALVTNGVVSDGQFETLAGAVAIVVGIGWSWWQKKGK